jgi:predicted Zn-dependent protease
VLGFSTATAARVSINSGDRGNTRFAGNQISTAGDNTNTSVTVRSVIGNKIGQAGTNKLDEAGLKAVVTCRSGWPNSLPTTRS